MNFHIFNSAGLGWSFIPKGKLKWWTSLFPSIALVFCLFVCFFWHPGRKAKWCVMFSLDLRYIYQDLFGIHKTAIPIPPAYPLKHTALLRKTKRHGHLSYWFFLFNNLKLSHLMRMERKQQYIPTCIIHFIGLSTKCECEGIRNP